MVFKSDVSVQELSAHLAAEITRLCSLAKQDELPLSQKMDAYEMEVRLLFIVPLASRSTSPQIAAAETKLCLNLCLSTRCH